MKQSEAQLQIQNRLTDPTNIMRGLKKGNEVAPVMFKTTLEYVIRSL